MKNGKTQKQFQRDEACASAHIRITNELELAK